MISNLPVELQNKIFFYAAEHPCAKMIKRHILNKFLQINITYSDINIEHLKSMNFDSIFRKSFYILMKEIYRRDVFRYYRTEEERQQFNLKSDLSSERLMEEYVENQEEKAISESYNSVIDVFYNVHFDNRMNISCNFRTIIKSGKVIELSYNEAVNNHLDRHFKHVSKSPWRCDVIQNISPCATDTEDEDSDEDSDED